MSSLTVGQWARAPANASRSPCPVVNALANHGYLERSGKKIYMKDLNASMRHVGMSPLLGSVFAIPTYFEYHDPSKGYTKKSISGWQRIWQLIKNPYSFFDYFGCWNANQTVDGKKYLNLENLAAHGAIEHDISLSRRDIGQPQGNNDPQHDLIRDMLKYTDDGETMTIDDLSYFIKARIAQQLEANPNLVYGKAEHQINCGQVALMMGCFGDGKTIPVKYVKAIFEDERLPVEEGWSRRFWWTMGLVEFFGAVNNLFKKVALDI
ncbi:hypothetical protein FLONG3_2560 [Fusarium longipes]|uniref:Heme haloperoxidase family profile domain-containing protein n=1 Tax=Fusarium longipes TaxID=694270 RepID=A0A395T3U0_9HYPO|nr:hypothetical protein FLONG3_2560 [Fusarium longipes]